MGRGHGSVQRELVYLVAAGILSRRRHGREVFYGPNPTCPIYQELHSLVIKTCGVVGVVRQTLEPLRGRIQLALIFGSFACGEENSGSDVDLLIVGETEHAELMERIMELESTLKREVDLQLFGVEEFRRRLSEGSHFLSAILGKPFILLIGGADELERLGVGQSAQGGAFVAARDC
ncbi:MAG: nucleotidyltransferase domain-containing protein [bacterium]|nr:nucleotidyltransferase domain-containing protein [bacterium]